MWTTSLERVELQFLDNHWFGSGTLFPTVDLKMLLPNLLLLDFCASMDKRKQFFLGNLLLPCITEGPNRIGN